jgi:hypothetical protein
VTLCLHLVTLLLTVRAHPAHQSLSQSPSLIF